MTSQPKGLDQALEPATPELRRIFETKAFGILSEKFDAALDPRDRWGLTASIPAARLREAVLFLRDDPSIRLDMLLDITAVDYLGYPGHDAARYAVVYNLRSQRFASHRLRLKVWVEEEDPQVPSIHDLYEIADWQERETWDQYGIDFSGHPDLRRLLNHIEFTGHPLRKDYPVRKRQWLSTNDPLIAPLEARLEANGFTVLEHVPVNSPSVEETDLLGKAAVEKINYVGKAK
jgi:NADH-quinone oxidoreductase subunit C/NADH-quinone oxidoreductase subunit C/D